MLTVKTEQYILDKLAELLKDEAPGSGIRLAEYICGG
jgi:hypothetical protein